MLLASGAVLGGLLALTWSADKFVDGSVGVARHFQVPALLIGILIVGFGTSAPELVVSALAAMQGNPGLALGNAYGSNITNIALILGLTAFLKPISIHSKILRKELPILALVTVLAGLQLWDGAISRMDAWILLLAFFSAMGWATFQGLKERRDTLAMDMEKEFAGKSMSLSSAWLWLGVGFVVLVGSSRLLVWGAVELARGFGVSDLVIGLTIVALGTSLPELASSIAAVRKGEHDIALGNVIGSNLFNTLAVVGLAGAIHPMKVASEVFSRDLLVMIGLTGSLFFFRRKIGRWGGVALLATYVTYMAIIAKSTLG